MMSHYHYAKTHHRSREIRLFSLKKELPTFNKQDIDLQQTQGDEIKKIQLYNEGWPLF